MAQLDFLYISSLVNKVKDGDSNAFAELYAATYQKQYRFARQYLKDEFLAQDALQEVYLLAIKNLDKLKDSKVFLSWLNQINFRVCFNMQHKNAQHQSELQSDVEMDELLDSSSYAGDPEVLTSQHLEKEEVFSQILKLPRKESQVIIMRYYNNMKLEDIATAMDCSRSTVKRYIISGRDRLQSSLTKNLSD